MATTKDGRAASSSVAAPSDHQSGAVDAGQGSSNQSGVDDRSSQGDGSSKGMVNGSGSMSTATSQSVSRRDSATPNAVASSTNPNAASSSSTPNAVASSSTPNAVASSSTSKAAKPGPSSAQAMAATTGGPSASIASPASDPSRAQSSPGATSGAAPQQTKPRLRYPLPIPAPSIRFPPLLHDHHTVLQPDYQTAFKGASDVVARLAPWHVWQIPEDVIQLAKRDAGRGHDHVATDIKGKGKAESEVNGIERPLKRRRRARYGDGSDDVQVVRKEKAGLSEQAHFERIQGLDFPTDGDLEDLIPRFKGIRARWRSLRHRATGGQGSSSGDHEDADLPILVPSPFGREGHLQVLGLAYLEQRSRLEAELEELMTARSAIVEEYGSKHTEELDREAPGFVMPPMPASHNVYVAPAPPKRQPSPQASKNTGQGGSNQGRATPSSASARKPSMAQNASSPQPPVHQRAPSTPGLQPHTQPRVQPHTQPPVQPHAQPHAQPRPQNHPQMQGPNSVRPSGARPVPVGHLPAHQQTPAMAAGTAASPNVTPGHSGPGTPIRPMPGGSPSSFRRPSQAASVRPEGGAGATRGPVRPVAAAPPATNPAQQHTPQHAPQHTPQSGPIRIILPLSLIPKLTTAGIIPLPARHLQPAIEAHQKRLQASHGHIAAANIANAIADPSHGFNTSPVDPDPNQREAAVLLGITEAAVGANSGDGGQRPPKLVHVSVVLARLTAAQLNALASAVNVVQQQSGSRGAAPARPPTQQPAPSSRPPAQQAPGPQQPSSQPPKQPQPQSTQSQSGWQAPSRAPVPGQHDPQAGGQASSGQASGQASETGPK